MSLCLHWVGYRYSKNNGKISFWIVFDPVSSVISCINMWRKSQFTGKKSKNGKRCKSREPFFGDIFLSLCQLSKQVVELLLSPQFSNPQRLLTHLLSESMNKRLTEDCSINLLQLIAMILMFDKNGFFINIAKLKCLFFYACICKILMAGYGSLTLGLTTLRLIHLIR